MIFVDTGAWYARFVRDDPDHPAATKWFAAVSERLVTTDYVIDELLTLLKVRGNYETACAVGGRLMEGFICRLEYVQPHDINGAWTVFAAFKDKGWSFTDCVSKVVMDRLKVSTACAFDEHFRQFGNVTVVP